MTPMEYEIQALGMIKGWHTVTQFRNESNARTALAELQLQFPITKFRLLTRPWMDWLDVTDEAA